MWKVEEDFPRGGGLKERQQNDNDSPKPEMPSPDIKKGKRNKQNDNEKKRKRVDMDVSTSTFKTTKRRKIDDRIDYPLARCLATDLLVLGCVRETFEYSVSVSLPGNKVATLPITEISPAYTNQLQKLAQATDVDATEDVRPVDEMFKPGLLVPVVVKSIEEDKSSKKQRLKLSCAPTTFDYTFPLSSVMDGMLLFGNILSVEDHGYRMDLGIKGLQAFLTTKDAEQFIKTKFNGEALSVGQPLWCVVKIKNKSGLKSGEARTVNVTIDPADVKKAFFQETTNLNSLLPGCRVKATVEKKVNSGLMVKVYGFDAVVHGSQLPKSAITYKVKSEIEVRVLYVDHATKVIQLTALPKVLNFDGGPIDFFHEIKRGQIFEAKVSRVEKKKGLYFKLPNDGIGFAQLSQLSDKTEKPDITDYKLEQTYKCRVFGFNYMEGSALVTLKQSIIDQKFLTVDDISVGDIVEGSIREVFNNGVSIKLAKSINAFIPGVHLADVPIKHPEKKFEAGMNLKCRVVRVDKQKSKVMLTHKKSLVKTKLPIISEYSQVLPHMVLEGVIITIKERVVIVALFGNVKGFVTLNDMSTEKVEDPTTMFYVGQVIRCRVVYFNVAEEKLKLSFNFGSQAKKKPASDSSCEIDKITSAVIASKDTDGFTISLLPGKEAAFLPFSQLSDYTEVQELRKTALKAKDLLEELTLFKQKKQIIMTMKESFIDAARENQLTENFTDLKSGQLMPAVIKNHEDYGIFLELAAGHIGLCPSRTLTNLQPNNLKDLFKKGQTVVTRLSKIDSEKKRFLGSLRLDECYEGGLKVPLSLLQNYLSARKHALEKLFSLEEYSCYSNIKVGEVVSVKVSSVHKKGILGELESGAKALATKHHYGGVSPEEGKNYKAVVLFVDPLTPCVELTLEPKVVKAVQNRKDNSKSKVKPGQVLKADVLLVKPEFLLMGLRGHGAGKMVFVPSRKHMNDVEVNPVYQLGTYADVVVKECFDGVQLATLLMHDPEAKAKAEEELEKKKEGKQKSKIGTTIKAKVKTVFPLQLNITSNNLNGRVHVSEVADEPKQGKNPVYKYRQGQEINVRVIGVRNNQPSYLPITNSKVTRTLLECSLKPSKMESANTEQLLVEHCDLSPGDKTWVYIIKVLDKKVWVQIGLTQQGFISFFNLSDDINVINNPAAHFLPGQAYLATVLKSVVSNKDGIEMSLIDSTESLEIGNLVNAQITSIKPDVCLNVRLSGGKRGTVTAESTVIYAVDQYIRCEVKGLKKETVILAMDQKSHVLPTAPKRKRKLSIDEQSEEARVNQEKLLKRQKKLEKKKLKHKKKDEQEDSGVEDNTNSSDKEEDTELNSTKSLQMSLPSFSWDGELPSLQTDGNIQDDDDDDDNVAAENVKSKKKKKRDEEKLIQEYERSQLSGTAQTPQSAADFERLVLQSPHSSLMWLSYMAHHIELAELERARAVAERALSTISFREEQEKENVWLAYLNMETTYGEEKDVKKLIERAVQYCEPLNIYSKQCDMYIGAGKAEEAEQLYIVMTRKFKKEKSVWKAYAQFLFKANRTQSARNLLQKCITVLEKKDHVEVITRFATLEFNHGDAERGRTMFENLIASYPGRTDLWSVYVDMVVKVGDIEGARHLLERAVKLKLSSKKISFLLQKFVKFEETHGTEEKVQHVKDMAVKIMDS